jgi:hypothetical protein
MILVGDLRFCMQCFVDLGFVGNTFFYLMGFVFFVLFFVLSFACFHFYLIEFFVLLALMVTCLFSTTLVVVFFVVS